MGIRRAAVRLSFLPLIVLAGGLLGATFARLAPGFGTDERELDGVRGEANLQALRRSSGQDLNLVDFYRGYLTGLLHGHLGVSRSLDRPVRDLITERLPL